MTGGNPFEFTAADWRSATRLRARVHGTVAQYRRQLACPVRSLATFEALHDALTEALAAESVPDPATWRAACCSRPLIARRPRRRRILRISARRRGAPGGRGR